MVAGAAQAVGTQELWGGILNTEFLTKLQSCNCNAILNASLAFNMSEDRDRGDLMCTGYQPPTHTLIVVSYYVL